MGVKERLIQFIEYKKLAVRTFEKSIGRSNGFVKNMSKSTQPEIFEKISNTYPELNITWLIIGKGEMLTTEPPSPDHLPEYIAEMRSEGRNIHLSQMKELTAMKELMEDLREQIDELKKTDVHLEEDAECADAI